MYILTVINSKEGDSVVVVVVTVHDGYVDNKTTLHGEPEVKERVYLSNVLRQNTSFVVANNSRDVLV